MPEKLTMIGASQRLMWPLLSGWASASHMWCEKIRRFRDLLTFPWVGSTASIGHFWAAADAAGRSLTCPLPAQRVHRGSRVKGGRRPSQRDALAPLTREGCTRGRRGPDLRARRGTQSRCSEIDPRKRHKSHLVAQTDSEVA